MRASYHGRAEYLSADDLELQLGALRALGLEAGYTDDDPRAALESEILVVHSGIHVNRAFLERWPRLRLLITSTSGWDHIDLGTAAERGVRVARSPLARRDAVVETSIALALALLRRVPLLHDRAREGVWSRGELAGRGLALATGSTIGVVGCGVIGSRAVDLWRSLGAGVLVSDPALESSEPIEALVERSDVVTLHCSLTPGSLGLIDAALLSRMKPGAVLVNTARGRVIDLDALAETSHLGGIGLDVFPTEPFPQLAEWAQRPNVLLLPHAAGHHAGLGAAVAREVATTVKCWLEGRPLPHEVPASGD